MSFDARAISVRKGRTLVLDQVSFRLAPGAFTAILGLNGAGKSTALAALAGAQKLSGGAVFLDDQPLAELSSAARARRRAVLTQDTVIAFPFLAHEVVAMGRAPHEVNANPSIVTAAMGAAGVTHLARRNVQTLSGGERQRVMLAKALAQIWDQPNAWLLLDEPIAALDPAYQVATLNLLRAQAARGVGVVAVLHDLDLAAAFADAAIVLKHGRVFAQCAPSELTTASVLRDVFNVDEAWRRRR